MARRITEFQTIRSEGGLLPPDLLRRVLEPKEKLDGTSPEDYGLPQGERLNEVITQSWNRLRKHWTEFCSAAANLPAGEAGTGLTNDKWNLPLLRELGFGLLPTSAGPEINGRTYAISRFFGPMPIHLVGCGLSLDHRTAGVRGAATANPHGLVQEFLNRSSDHLWAIVSNGLRLRVLRDNQALSRQSFLEFDLEAMFAGEVYSDFVLLWLIAHATRFASREGNRADTCWLEQWTKIANEQGARALGDLKGGVERALQILGEGFTSHPKNSALRDALRTGQVPLGDFHGQLLRVVYRLIFLFVAEDRTIDGRPLLHPRDDSDAAQIARERYAAHYSTARLRDLAALIKGSRHGDLWRQFQVVTVALSGNAGFAVTRQQLALPALGSFLWDAASTTQLNDAELTNHDFLEALRDLAFTRQGKVLRPVDYKNLGAEELGGVYESLLALTPQISADGGRFGFAEFAGNERKTSGSYYTPDSLVQCLLDSALDPVVEEAIKGKTGTDAEGAILALKVCDPAAGSGHFLVGAAHRLARHLSRVRALAQGESEPSPLLYQHALRDVIGHCLYGVDMNPMAVELCRVSLWLEALEPGKPLSFLEHRIQCGNSLLGATPALLAKGIPDEVFTAIEGDDKELCKEFKRINKDERKQQMRLFAASTEPWHQLGNLAASLTSLDALVDDSIEGIREKQRRYEEVIRSGDYLSGRFWADAWCAAFVWKKTNEFNYPITEEVFRRIERNQHSVDVWMRDEIERLAKQYQFFHWHLAFPDVFHIPPAGVAPGNKQTGWNGGFDCMLGNPPWERVKLQEKEWFAERRPEIANAPNAAARKRLIEALVVSDPSLHQQFLDDTRRAEGESHVLRNGGLYPLCGVGDLNTFAVFAERSYRLLNSHGRFGMVLPTGIATSDTTKLFFAELMENNRLRQFIGFDNEEKTFFPDIDNNLTFAAVILGPNDGSRPKFCFNIRKFSQLAETDRYFELTNDDLTLFNPNTRTCPIFRSANDALITRFVYQHFPLLLRELPSRQNPWGIDFLRMFDMANDSALFRSRAQLEDDGAVQKTNCYFNGVDHFVPLYEAKMIWHFEHRWASDFGKVLHDDRPSRKYVGWYGVRYVDPDDLANGRYWVEARQVGERAGEDARHFVAYRSITNRDLERTSVFTLVPAYGIGHKAPVVRLNSRSAPEIACFVADRDSFISDFVTRNKQSGSDLSYFVLKQLPALPPQGFEKTCLWSEDDQSLQDWILPRVLELIYTAWDLEPFARDCGWTGAPFRWDEERRLLIRCELDAVFFHLYLPADGNSHWLLAKGETAEDLARLKANFPTPRDAVAYIMDTFPIVKRNDETKWGEYRTKRIILEIYDAMAETMRTGQPYQTRLDPPPADPSCRHPKKKIGILAFGSLINDPGEEIQAEIFMRIKTKTPFPVEYARISGKTRGGAPTLVPHQLGAPVPAEILVLDDDVSTGEAVDMLWRRETRKTGSNERYVDGTTANSVLVRELHDDPCVSTVLYTDFPALGKLKQPEAEDLARRAIQSVRDAEEGKDGITYLMDALAVGIETPLTQSYRDQVLEQTDTMSLQDALAKVKREPVATKEGSRT